VGDNQGAAAACDKARVLAFEPKNAQAANNYARFLGDCPDSRLRDPKRAVELAQKAVELAPKDGMTWNTLGVAHYRAGDWKAAIAALNRAEGLAPDQNGAFDAFFLAMAHWQLGREAEAQKWWDKALQWTDKNKELLQKNRQWAEELDRFRAEAAELLKINKRSTAK
jgi:tetratricopeptide (TPR) repeat protein